MNSDVEGYFTAKVNTNVYDTATGRHLLVPQGATIGGRDHGSTLLYGNERCRRRAWPSPLATAPMTSARPR